ncbi:MAG: aminotransferase class I/II-fold pyridoxal phosphate-dependent enzyme [Pseudomonadota bacterium]
MRSSRRGDVDPFIVMDVMAAAARQEAAGKRVIHMEVGQPGTPAPARARARLSQALDEPLGYTVALGLPELRAGIGALYQRWYGVDLDPGRVVVTAGSSAGFTLAFTACFDAGGRVGIGAPGYPSYRNILSALSLIPVEIETQTEDRYQPTPQAIRTTPDLDGVLVASPANPSGTMLGRDALSALINTAADRGITFISDEIYHGLHYGAPAVSALEITDDVIVINSFSKYFSMTGWRIGWMVVPDPMVRTVERLAQNLFICAPHAAQVAALGALEASEELDANRATYSENRRLLMDALPQMGFGAMAPPDGAFYIYADISAFADDAQSFCAELLETAQVAITPGNDFDPRRGHRMVRFSYARATEDIVEGIARLGSFMAARAGGNL